MKRKLVDTSNVSANKCFKTDAALESDFINYISVQSLESIATVKVATVLCMQSDVKEAMRKHSLEFDSVGGGEFHTIRGTSHDASFLQIEKNILNKLSLLPLPNLLKAKVSNIIRPIESQVLSWIRYDRKDIEYINSVCWTTDGTIDKINTLKQLIAKDDGQHIHSLYKLACMFCLEESIPNLWGKLPEKIKENCINNRRIYKKYDNHLIAFWTHYINNELSELFCKIKQYDNKEIYNCHYSLNWNMFSLSLFQGNCLAVKYFWKKLTDVEVSDNLTPWINNAVRRRKSGIYSGILYFLLSKMNDKEQQGEVLQQNSDVILNSLFGDWPWQRFLLPTIQQMWNFLDEEVYVKLLINIQSQIKEGKTTEQLFRNLWHDSPVKFKNSFIQHILHRFDGSDVFCNLFIVKDIGTIKAVTDYANVEEHKKIIFSLVENYRLFEVIYSDAFTLLDLFIEVLSKSEIKEIKQKIVFLHGNRLCHKWISEDDWNMVDKFLSWSFTSEDQIENFKNKEINKIEITYSIIFHQGNYELVNKFFCWCFDSEEEINFFKKHLTQSKPEIVQIGSKNWCSLENFICWCFDSQEEVNEFRLNILQSYQVRCTIHDEIAFNFNFEFIDKLISWCCHSTEEINQFKSKFVFSSEWISILQRFVSNYKVYDSEWNNWELTKKLIKLFSPLEEHIIIKLKERIGACIDFDDFRPDYMCRSDKIEKNDLFRLLDDHNFDLGNDGSITDSGDSTESDGDGSVSNFDQDPAAIQVLNETLNRVENDLLQE